MLETGSGPRLADGSSGDIVTEEPVETPSGGLRRQTSRDGSAGLRVGN